MSDAQNPQSAGLEKTVADARRLLDYAVSRGIVKDTSVIRRSSIFEAKLASGMMPEHSDIETFLKAYNTLSDITGGVSGESFEPGGRQRCKPHEKYIYYDLDLSL